MAVKVIADDGALQPRNVGRMDAQLVGTPGQRKKMNAGLLPGPLDHLPIEDNNGPCVEDQFRLVVNFANTNDTKKTWWDFTEERKKFRTENGYPKSRPQKAWFEILGSERKDNKGRH